MEETKKIIEELKKEIRELKAELSKIKKNIENHRHDGHGYSVVDSE